MVMGVSLLQLCVGAVRVSGVQRIGVNVQGGGCGGCEGQWGGAARRRECAGRSGSGGCEPTVGCSAQA